MRGGSGLSDDFDRYSCANSGSTSLYTVMRPVLAELFGDALTRALDDINSRVRIRRLRSLGYPHKLDLSSEPSDGFRTSRDALA